METFIDAGASAWTEYGARSRAIHESLIAQNDDALTRILNDPLPTTLFYGFYSLAKDLGVDDHSQDGQVLGEWSVKQIFGCLIRLAEAVGSLRLWNPEGEGLVPGTTSDGLTLDVEDLLRSIDQGIGVRVDFPNPFSGEFGLPSSRGIISYRAPQAIYQAWRVVELLRRLKGAKFLEIGAGMGRTAYYARRLGLSDITLIDLPLGNVAQAAFLGRTLGGEAIWMPGDSASHQIGRIRVCPPHWLKESSESFDLVLNADSMPEMDKDHAVSYFREINRRAKLFLSINQEAYAFRVRDLPDIAGICTRTERYPYWMRKGYVEELFYLERGT